MKLNNKKKQTKSKKPCFHIQVNQPDRPKLYVEAVFFFSFSKIRLKLAGVKFEPGLTAILKGSSN